jgi:hypothetical protein
VGSRLNHAGSSSAGGGGGGDLTSFSLADDYFSDVNIKSVRRLMNIIYIMGRLLKSFNIDFRDRFYEIPFWPKNYSDKFSSSNFGQNSTQKDMYYLSENYE